MPLHKELFASQKLQVGQRPHQLSRQIKELRHLPEDPVPPFPIHALTSGKAYANSGGNLRVPPVWGGGQGA